jgi:hypothetical protein
MRTQDFSNAELLFLVQAINRRPGKISKRATLDNVADFDIGFVIACARRFPARTADEIIIRERVLPKLIALANDPINRYGFGCRHARTRKTAAGRIFCRDCQRLID